jgi:hypothetical protein
MLGTKTANEPQRDLLAEANLSAKGQRKADWGIIKEMSRYLWPKVLRDGCARGRGEC